MKTYFVKKSIYNCFVELENEFVGLNTRTLSLLVLNQEEFEYYNSVEKDTLINDTLGIELYKAGFLVDAALDEKTILKYRLLKGRFSDSRVNLTIAPTLDCNFSCTYCYERQDSPKSKEIMSNDIQRCLVEFVKKRLRGCKTLAITWYGGEPLLGFGVIKNLSEKFIELCQELNINYIAGMITNGYLLDKHTKSEYKSLNINDFQITLDGSQQYHDKRRMLKSGKGTFNKIIENIERLHNDFDVSVRINVDKDNIDSCCELITEFYNRNLTDVYLHLAPVVNSKNSNNTKCIDTCQFTKIKDKFTKQLLKYNMMNTEESLVVGVANYCDADSEHSLVIDNYGNIYKCWHDIGEVNCRIGNLSCDNNNNAILFYKYMGYEAPDDLMCSECKMLPLCMGGCPYNRIHKLQRCICYKENPDELVKKMYYREKNIYEES